MLKEPPAGEVMPFESSAIPANAKPLGKKARAGPAPTATQAAQAKRQAGRTAVGGPAIGENTATPISRIKVAKDFKVELLYSAAGREKSGDSSRGPDGVGQGGWRLPAASKRQDSARRYRLVQL